MKITAESMREKTQIAIQNQDKRLKEKYKETIQDIDMLISCAADNGQFYSVANIDRKQKDYVVRYYKNNGFDVIVSDYYDTVIQPKTLKIKISWE